MYGFDYVLGYRLSNNLVLSTMITTMDSSPHLPDAPNTAYDAVGMIKGLFGPGGGENDRYSAFKTR